VFKILVVEIHHATRTTTGVRKPLHAWFHDERYKRFTEGQPKLLDSIVRKEMKSYDVEVLRGSKRYGKRG